MNLEFEIEEIYEESLKSIMDEILPILEKYKLSLAQITYLFLNIHQLSQLCCYFINPYHD